MYTDIKDTIVFGQFILSSGQIAANAQIEEKETLTAQSLVGYMKEEWLNYKSYETVIGKCTHLAIKKGLIDS